MGLDHWRYMQSPEWKTIRMKVLTRDKSRCVVCDKFSPLHNEVHHNTYDRLGKLGEIDDCVTVCREHHQGLHATNNYLKHLK